MLRTVIDPVASYHAACRVKGALSDAGYPKLAKVLSYVLPSLSVCLSSVGLTALTGLAVLLCASGFGMPIGIPILSGIASTIIGFLGAPAVVHGVSIAFAVIVGTLVLNAPGPSHLLIGICKGLKKIGSGLSGSLLKRDKMVPVYEGDYFNLRKSSSAEIISNLRGISEHLFGDGKDERKIGIFTKEPQYDSLGWRRYPYWIGVHLTPLKIREKRERRVFSPQ